MNEINLGWILLIVMVSFFAIFSIALLICFCVEENPKDFYYWDNVDKKTKKKTLFIYLTISISWLFIIVSGLSCALGFGIKGIINNVNESYNYKKYDIISLERSSDISGHFMIGSGYIDQDEVYYVYTVTDYGYKLEKLNTEYTYIKQTDEIAPSVYHYKEAGNKYSYYHIYCPVGTIIEHYIA